MVYSVITEWKCAAKIKHSSLRMHGNRTRENWTHTAIQVIYDKKNMRVLLFLLTVGFFFFFIVPPPSPLFVRVIKHQHRLPRAGESPALQVLKTQLSKA